jgi:hypothetical protein
MIGPFKTGSSPKSLDGGHDRIKIASAVVRKRVWSTPPPRRPPRTRRPRAAAAGGLPARIRWVNLFTFRVPNPAVCEGEITFPRLWGPVKRLRLRGLQNRWYRSLRDRDN